MKIKTITTHITINSDDKPKPRSFRFLWTALLALGAALGCIAVYNFASLAWHEKSHLDGVYVTCAIFWIGKLIDWYLKPIVEGIKEAIEEVRGDL